MLECGAITVKQIQGNDQADELSILGAALHQVDEKVLRAQDHRRKIARIYQKMINAIWSKHFETYVDSKGRPITPSNNDDLSKSEVIVQAYLDYNHDKYDPFGDVMLCDMAGNDVPPPNQPTTYY